MASDSKREPAPKHIAERPHVFKPIEEPTASNPTAAPGLFKCEICHHEKDAPWHVEDKPALPTCDFTVNGKGQVEVEPEILLGFKIKTELRVKAHSSSELEFVFEKEFSFVAKTAAGVKAYFDAHPELGKVLKIEDRGQILVLHA